MHIFSASFTSAIAISLAILSASVTANDDVPFVADKNTPFESDINTNSVTFLKKNEYPTAPAQPTQPESLPFTTFNTRLGNPIPDLSGAVSSSNVVTMINRLFSVQTKSGAHLFETNFVGFWSRSTNTGNLTNVFDPVVVFDPHERRFVATCAHNLTRPTRAC